ncbi:polycystin family receptor for egg jelly-like [Liolophura sinensis]|uniref:polycystin family receptor for egg jelly-like n=1 Tax=Liolophura sinensis TaxID=3198878 RepID=UPI0031598DF0
MLWQTVSGACILLTLCAMCKGQCPSTVWTEPSRDWCVGPPATHTIGDLFMKTDLSDTVLAVTLLPKVSLGLLNHFLDGFVLSYTSDTEQLTWYYYKEKSGPSGKYTVKVFPGLTATEMESPGPLPTLYLSTPVTCTALRLHVRPIFPISGACMGADLVLSSCASNPQTPTHYPNPTCGAGEQLQYGFCKAVNDSYAFGNSNLKTAALAQSGCALRGGNLVSFRSEAEMDAMITELTAASPGSTWIIGLVRNDLGEYRYWMDDSEVDFTAWATGHPTYDLAVRPMTILNKNLGWRWMSGAQNQKARFTCRIDRRQSRRLVGGYYKAPSTHLSSSHYVTEGSFSSYLRNSLVNGRFGQDPHFYVNTSPEVYQRDDGFKPVFTWPYHTKGPYMEVIFDMPMVIEAVMFMNTPTGPGPNKFTFKYSANSYLITYTESGQQKVFEIAPGTDYPVVAVLNIPVETMLFSASLVTTGDTSTQLFWDVIGYMSESIQQMDLCVLADHGCTQTCLITPGSYRCDCDVDYRMGPDGKTCIHEIVCLSHYEKIGQECYRIVRSPVTYSEAMSTCAIDGATLTSIHSNQEFELLRRKLTGASVNFFIGLSGTKLLRERWSDASWVDRTYFHSEVPEVLAEPHVVYMDKDVAWAWGFGPQASTTAGYICKQLDNYCAVPQLAGPFPPYYTITSSSGTADDIILSSPDMNAFLHDDNTGESPVWVKVAFQDELTITGFIFSSGNEAGVQSFWLFYSTDDVGYHPVLDKLGENQQVFTLGRPPSGLAYFWIIPIVASYLRLEYNRPGQNSLRKGIAMEVLGCPVAAGVSTSHYCDSGAEYLRRFPDHDREFQCHRYCQGYSVDNTVTCADSYMCKINFCPKLSDCYENHVGLNCVCEPGFTGPLCDQVILRGVQLIASSPVGYNTDDLYIALFMEASPEDTVIYMDFGDDFYIEVRYKHLATVNDIATEHPTYNLTFLDSYSLDGHIGYVVPYRFSYMGLYNLSAVATSHYHTYALYFEVAVITDNACPTSLAVSSLQPSYLDRKVYLDSVDIRFLSDVNIACRAKNVLSKEWDWRVYFLTEFLPQPDPHNRVIFTSRTATDESSLVILPKMLPPGLYKVEAHLHLNITPGDVEVKASASGYIVVIEPAVHVAIVGGTFRRVSQGRVLKLEAVVSSFFPPEVLPSSIEDRFTWTCDVNGSPCSFVPSVWSGTYTDNFIPVDTPTFELAANTLTAGVNYTFVVYLQQIGFGNVATLFYSQVINVLSSSIPDVRIVCAINCGYMVRPDEKMTVIAACATCAMPTDLTYLWEFTALSSRSRRQSLDWGTDTGTLADEDVLVINPSVMDPGLHYRLTVHGTSADGLEGHADLTFQTTQVLDGHCWVSPQSGKAMQTEFKVTCDGFEGNTALTYQVFLSVSGHDKDRWTLLAESYLTTLDIGMLPVGTKAGSTHKLKVTVQSQMGTATSVYLTVTVHGLGADTDSTLVNLVLGTREDDASLLDRADMMGRPEAVVGLMTSIVPELNSVKDSGNVAQKTQIREKLVDVMGTLDTNDSSLIQPTAYVLDLLLQTNKDSVSETMMDNAANSSETMTWRFTEAVKRETPLSAEKTAEYLLSGVCRLQNMVTEKARDVIARSGTTDSSVDKSRSMTSTCLEQKENVLRVLARHKFPGEESSRFEGQGTVMMVRRDTPLSLTGEDVLDTKTHLGGCSIPWNVADVTGKPVTEVTTETMINSFDPYPWGDSDLGVPVNQSSVSLNLLSKEDGLMDIRDLPTPLDVFIPVNKKESSQSWEGEFKIMVYYDTDSGEVLKEPSLPMGLSVASKKGYLVIVKLILGVADLQVDMLVRAGAALKEDEEFYQDGAKIVTLPHNDNQTTSTGSITQDKYTVFLEEADYDSALNAYCASPNATCSGGTADGNRTFYLAFLPTPGQVLVPGDWDGECYNYTCAATMALVDTRISVLSTACVFWSKEENKWSTQGCVATRLSTLDQVHCSCTRVGLFSMSLFVMPNQVNPIKDILLFLTFFDNPLLVSVVLCIWLLYFVLLIWTRHRDKYDDSLSGVTVLTDNQPDDRYMYLIGVSTGWWRQADTSARVFMFLEGAMGRSSRHVLSDGRRKRFCKGADDWFLMTTVDSLGDLESVTVWHDNSGAHPSWFLKSVVVQDLLTHDTWTFMYNDWLSLDHGPLQILVTLPAFSAQEIRKNSTYQFLAKWTHDMRDQHLWFSIFAKPLQSPFTRTQRLSCALVLLLTAMLTNLMFYGIPTDNVEDQFAVQGLVFSVTSIMIGLETALIMFPINFVLVQLFLRVKPRIRTSVTDSFKKRKSSAKKLNDTAEEKLYEKHERGMSKQNNKLNSSRVEDEAENKSAEHKGDLMTSTSKDKSCKSTFRENVNNSARKAEKNQVNITGKPQDSSSDKPAKSTEDISANVSTPEPEDVHVSFVKEGLDSQTDVNKFKPTGVPVSTSANAENAKMKSVSVSSIQRGNVDKRGHLDQPQGYQPNPARAARMLPWWFVYINWLLLICTAFTASFFVMLYGLKFGYSRSVQWAVSFFTTFFTSAFITEPFKVVALALLLTLILKKHVTDQYHIVNKEDELEESFEKQRREGFETEEIAAPQTFTQRALDAVRERVRMQWRIQELLKELALYLSFVVVVVVVAHGHKHVDTCFRATKSVEDMFVHATYVNNTQPFSEVSTVEDMWEYISGSFLPNLYAIPQEALPSQSYPPLCANGVTFPIGLARLRQIRKNPEPCVGVVVSIPGVLGPCKTMDFYRTEDTASYSEGWKGGLVSSTGPWVYQSAWDLQTIPYMGQYSSYSGGGYVAEIPDSNPGRDNFIHSLQALSWVDANTMVIFIEFTVCNPSQNLFSVVMLSLEFIGTGEILPFHQILTTKLYHYGTDFEMFVAVCEVLFVFQTTSLCYIEIKRRRKLGSSQYFKDPWSYAELLTIFLCLVAIGMYVQRIVFVGRAVTDMREGQGQRFVNFYTAGLWDFILGYVFAALVFLVIIKIFKLVRFNRKLTLFSLTLRLSAKPLASFVLMNFLYFMPFVHLGWLVFGPSLESYKNTISTGLTLFNFALGECDYLSLSSVSSYVAPVYFLVFVFAVMFCLMNMLITMLMRAFKQGRLQIENEKNDYEVVDYMLQQFALAIGLHKKKKKSKAKKKKSANAR